MRYYRVLVILLSMCFELFPNGWAQSGFSVVHGESGGLSYSSGQFFYRQYQSGIAVSEGVEQSYLLKDTVRDDGCEGVAYNVFGVVYGDTLVEGLYFSRKYVHQASNGYDSVFVHLLSIYPRTVTYDTLLLEENDIGTYAVGESVDSLFSSHGCDSVVFRMVYAVSCPSDYVVTAPYGVSEVPFTVLVPAVIPSMDGVSVFSDAPPLLTVGVPSHVSWVLVAGLDTFRCNQDARADFPPCGDGFTAVDGDGNVYETVRIGADCWLRENIHATHYAESGEPVSVASTFRASSYPDTVANRQHYGCLYSWYSAMGIPENSTDSPMSNAEGEVRGICPVGWHIPTVSELSKLQLYDGPDLKAVGTFWLGEIPNDASSISLMPGGMYNAARRQYEELRTCAHLWLADAEATGMACSAFLQYVCSELGVAGLDKTNGCSVRCTKD